ncbi:hypothetical protein ACIQI8_34965 [Streptomyces sp. NPDC092369]|uniref:hypothetical protein n=1 Tax=Streptomyces sp. NPDC092369 TaxID=3366015 RepID=UPI003808ADA2
MSTSGLTSAADLARTPGVTSAAALAPTPAAVAPPAHTPAHAPTPAPAPALEPAVADGDFAPQGPPAPDNEIRTGGAGGSFEADGGAEAVKAPISIPFHHTKASI